MNASWLAWLALGVGLLLWPGGSRAGPGDRARRRRSEARERSGLVAAQASPSGRLAAVGAVAAGGLVLVIGGVPATIPAVLTGALAHRAVVRLARGPARSVADTRLPTVLDLIAAALRAGRPVPDAVRLAAPAAGAALRERLDQVSGLLALGERPEHAWALLGEDPALQEVSRAAVRSCQSGARLADGLDQAAADVRAQLRTEAVVRAQRTATLALGPLGACFLPAFVCLGVVPVVLGIMAGALGTAG